MEQTIKISKESLDAFKHDKNTEEYRELIDAADIVCGICVCRNEDTCDKCPVRITIENYFKNN